MPKKSFEGLGESYFDDWFRRLLVKEGINYLPPGTLKALDFVISREIIVLELEDTVLEVYNAIRQVESLMPIIRGFNLGVSIAIPFPERIEPLLVPIAKYFNNFREYPRKEFWLLTVDQIIRIYAENFSGFNLNFQTLKESKIRIKLHDGYFTKETAENLELMLKKLRS